MNITVRELLQGQGYELGPRLGGGGFWGGLPRSYTRRSSLRDQGLATSDGRGKS